MMAAAMMMPQRQWLHFLLAADRSCLLLLPFLSCRRGRCCTREERASIHHSLGIKRIARAAIIMAAAATAAAATAAVVAFCC
jgi:hypothetical protein